MKGKLFFALCFAVLFACSTGGDNVIGGDSSNSGNGGDNSSSSGNGGSGIGAYAVLPNNQNKSKIQEYYNDWINTYYTTYEQDLASGLFTADGANPNAPGTARIRAAYDGNSTGNNTCSEAVGYGMLLTALMEDWEKFDKLLAYSKLWRYSIQGNPTALMRWDVRSFVISVGGSATDADIDIVAALFIAYQKTGQARYKDDAIEVGQSIYDWEVHQPSLLLMPGPSNESWTNNLYNISYISLPAIKMLAEHDHSRNWNGVLEANLAYMEMVQNAGNNGNGGLWPDWSNASGTPMPTSKSADVLTPSTGAQVQAYETYYRECPRIPWRIAWYYHWYEDNRAKAMLDKGMAFLQGKGVSTSNDLKNFYVYADGREASANATIMAWTSLCALGMGNSANQGWMDSCNDRILGYFYPQLNTYYASSLQVLYAMLFNGVF